MLERITLWCRLIKFGCQCRRLRRQRDCLHKNFNVFAEKYFMYELLPEELVKVLDEIEGEE